MCEVGLWEDDLSCPRSGLACGQGLQGHVAGPPGGFVSALLVDPGSG